MVHIAPIGFLGRHPYLIGGALLGGFVLYLLLRTKASGTAETQPVGVQQAQVPANVQQAQVEAGAALQLANAQAAQQANQNAFQLALAAQKEQADYTQSQLDAYTSTQQQVNAIAGSTNLATINAGVQNNAISTQGAVMSQQIQAGVETTQLNDSLALDQTKINAGAAVQTAAIQGNTTVSVADVAAQAQQNIAAINGTTAVDLSSIYANTQTVVAGYGRDVALSQIDAAKTVAQTQLQTQAQTSQAVIGLVKSGQLNKGGAGGANQVAVLGAITGAPQIAAPAYGTATASMQGNSISSVIASIGNAVKTGASGFLA